MAGRSDQPAPPTATAAALSANEPSAPPVREQPSAAQGAAQGQKPAEAVDAQASPLHGNALRPPPPLPRTAVGGAGSGVISRKPLLHAEMDEALRALLEDVGSGDATAAEPEVGDGDKAESAAEADAKPQEKEVEGDAPKPADLASANIAPEAPVEPPAAKPMTAAEEMMMRCMAFAQEKEREKSETEKAAAMEKQREEQQEQASERLREEAASVPSAAGGTMDADAPAAASASPSRSLKSGAAEQVGSGKRRRPQAEGGENGAKKEAIPTTDGPDSKRSRTSPPRSPSPAPPSPPSDPPASPPPPPEDAAPPLPPKPAEWPDEPKSPKQGKPREAWEYIKKDTWGAGNFFDFNSF